MKVTLTKVQADSIVLRALQQCLPDVTSIEVVPNQPVPRWPVPAVKVDEKVDLVRNWSEDYLRKLSLSKLVELSLLWMNKTNTNKITVIRNFREWYRVNHGKSLGLLHTKWMVENLERVDWFVILYGGLPELNGTYPDLKMYVDGICVS